MNKIHTLAMVAAILWSSGPLSYDADEFQKKLDTLLSESGRMTDAYYFEKLGFHGEWVQTVLVYGYPNNLSACQTILRAADAESPGMSFRCNPAPR